jgi:hypothetical protein
MHEDKLPACENEALTVTKKDKKYYRKLYKQKDLDKKVQLVEVGAKSNFKRAVSLQIVPPVTVALPESVSISVHDAHTSGSATIHHPLLLNLLTNM